MLLSSEEATSNGDPPQAEGGVVINPFPHLGPILNQFEAMIISQGLAIERLCMIAKASGIERQDLDDLCDKMVAAHVAYNGFKNSLIEQGGSNGQPTA